MIKYITLFIMFALAIGGSAWGAYLNDRELMVLLGLPGVVGMLECMWIWGDEP